MSSPFRRELPARPDLDQQKTLAKELLRAFEDGDPEATARVRAALPDKPRIALADAQFTLAREYGFANWAALAAYVESARDDGTVPVQAMHEAIQRRDASAVRRLFERHGALRRMINEPVFAFNAPAIVAFANDPMMVEVLLEFGADPNARSSWWAGGFHPLHSATGVAAGRLVAAGARIDACAAAHLDRPEVLRQLLAEDPARVHERGGDGQTPLHFARSRVVAELLVDAGADLDARDVDHRATPAEWMLDRRRGAGRYELARYLVQRGARADIFLAAALGLTDVARAALDADPSLLDLRTGQGPYGEQAPSSYHIYFWTIGSGLTPLDVAAQFEQGETLAAMLPFASASQRLVLACRRGDAAGARAIVREVPGIVDQLRPEAHRALADAAWRGDARAVALMVEVGLDPSVAGHDSGTALHCAAWEGSVESVRAILSHPRAAALVPLRDARYGATPLGWCCHGSLHGDTSHDHAGVARLLLAAGAVPGKDTENASPGVRAVLTRG